MDVGDELRLRLRGEFGKGPEHGIVDRAVDVEPPALVRNFRRQAEIEHRPVLCQMLARRQALLRGGDPAGEEFALARPALLCLVSLLSAGGSFSSAIFSYAK